jgi:hypothetical protein
VFQLRFVRNRVKKNKTRRLGGVDLKREEGGRGNTDHADKYGRQWRDATVKRCRRVVESTSYGSRAGARFAAGFL